MAATSSGDAANEFIYFSLSLSNCNQKKLIKVAKNKSIGDALKDHIINDEILSVVVGGTKVDGDTPVEIICKLNLGNSISVETTSTIKSSSEEPGPSTYNAFDVLLGVGYVTPTWRAPS